MSTSMMMMYPVFHLPQQHQQALPPTLELSVPEPFFGAAAPSFAFAAPASPVLSPVAAAAAGVPEELRCQYSSKRCENRRTHKKSGGLHKFCAVHREKANRNQMRLDHRRRVLKRLAQRGGAQGSPAGAARGSPYAARHGPAARAPLDVEDDLELDLMPLALHRENNPPALAGAQQPLFDPQDLLILETLLFDAQDGDAADADDVRQQQRSRARKPSASKKKTPSGVKTERADASSNSSSNSGSWVVNL